MSTKKSIKIVIILTFLFIYSVLFFFFFLLQPPLLKAIFNVDPDEVRSLIFKKEDVNAQVSPTVINICICFLILLLYFGNKKTTNAECAVVLERPCAALHSSQYYIFKWWCLFQNKAVLAHASLQGFCFLFFS